MDSKKADKIPKWLKTLQENSWELELLISGGAIFSLFQFSDLFISWILDIRMTSHIAGAGPLMLIGMFGIKVLTLGFTLHLMFRAYWLSLVCINYVYPNGVIQDNIQLRKPFKIGNKGIKEIKEHIISIDKLCGSIMYLSIISAFTIIGLVISFIVLMFTIIRVELINESAFFEILFTTLFISYLLYIIDIIFFGVFRKIPLLTYLLFPFFKLFDFLSFRYIIQKSLRLFNTNINKLKFLFFAILFSSAAFLFAYQEIYRVMHWPNLLDQRDYKWQLADDYFTTDGVYLDKWNEEIHSRRVAIGSQVIHSNYLEVFVLYVKNYDGIINNSSEVDSLKLFSNTIEVKIDSQLVNNIRWIPTRKGKDYLFGLTGMIPINKYDVGHHLISVVAKTPGDVNEDIFKRGGYEENIHFWIDRINQAIPKKKNSNTDTLQLN